MCVCVCVRACCIFKVCIELGTVLLLSYVLVFFGHKTCGILAPQPGIEPVPSALEGKVLTTRPPGKFLKISFKRCLWMCISSLYGFIQKGHPGYLCCSKRVTLILNFPSSEVKLLSRVWVFATPWTAAHQALPSMGFSRQEYQSGLPFPSPGDLPNPGIEPRSPTL